jgi:hypothetical protein
MESLYNDLPAIEAVNERVLYDTKYCVLRREELR